MSDKKRFSHSTHGCIIVYSLRTEAKCLFHWDRADCSAFNVELTASRRGAELTATALCLALTDTEGAELTASTALCLELTATKGREQESSTAFLLPCSWRKHPSKQCE